MLERLLKGVKPEDLEAYMSSIEDVYKLVEVLEFRPEIDEDKNAGGHSAFYLHYHDSVGNNTLINNLSFALKFIDSASIADYNNISITNSRVGRQFKEASKIQVIKCVYAEKLFEFLGTHKNIKNNKLEWSTHDSNLSIGKCSGYFTEGVYVVPKVPLQTF